MFSVNIKIKNKNKNAYAKLKKKLEEINSKYVVAGFPKGKLNNAHYSNGASIIDVAIWNQYGTNNIPRRDFMGPAAKNWNEYFKNTAEEYHEDLLSGQMSYDDFLNLMGQRGAEFVSEAIVKLKTPPNAESTIKRKKSSNPLIDTGDMSKAPIHEIRRNSK